MDKGTEYKWIEMANGCIMEDWEYTQCQPFFLEAKLADSCSVEKVD